MTARDASLAHSEGRDHSFAVLDGLRGVAAIVVMIEHYCGILSQYKLQWLPNGNLAVDFFFVLSGFVIAHAYDQRLASGWPPLKFMLRRLIRLYPLYALGLTLALLNHLFAFSGDVAKGQSPLAFLLSYGCGMLFLPTPRVLIWQYYPVVFPLNGPAWSLSLELAVNALYGWIGHHLTRWRLRWWLIGAALLLTALLWRDDTINLGWQWPSYGGGWARILWSFFAGLALRRIFPLRTINRLPPWVFPLLGLAMVIDMSCHGDYAYWLINVLIVLPVIVLGGAQTKPWPRLQRVYSWLGRTSYAIYILQLPLLDLLLTAAKALRLDPGAQLAVSITLCSGAAIAIVSLIDVIYDMPVRAWLTRRLVQRPSAAAAA